MEKVIGKQLKKIIWIFTIGSFIGYLVETIVTIAHGHYEVRKGLLYGPFIPVYGIGMVMYYLLLLNCKFKNDVDSKNKIIRNIIFIFVITGITGGITEYVSSYVQELCFGTISWDYSYLALNFAGRTSIKHCMFWGLLGIVYYIIGARLIEEKSDFIIDKKITKIATLILTFLMLINIILSIGASYRQYERRKNIEANNIADDFFDKYYPDEYLKKIYVNSIEK